MVYGMLSFGISAATPFDMAVPNVSLTRMKTTVFGALPTMSNTAFCARKPSRVSIGAVGKLRYTNL